MSLKSNKWTPRRHRHPRPAVCKSTDPYRDWPLALLVDLQWLTGGSGGDLCSFTGEVVFVRLKNSITYTGFGVSGEGKPWSAQIVLPYNPGPVYPLLTTAIMIFAFAMDDSLVVITGQNEAWTRLSQPPVSHPLYRNAVEVGLWSWQVG